MEKSVLRNVMCHQVIESPRNLYNYLKLAKSKIQSGEYCFRIDGRTDEERDLMIAAIDDIFR
jgi:hypothetical protein